MNKKSIKLLLLLLIALTAAVFFFFREPVRQVLFESGKETQKQVKYIFIMIGDGMGEAQRDIAQCYAANCGEKTPLIMNSLPVRGVVATHSLNADITDSAAAATAYATGHKTNNGMISVNPFGEELRTIIEEAEQNGYSTGLVTTSRITDATPAAFASHEESRTLEADIALDYLCSGVDFFAGGGAEYFLPTSYSGGSDAAGLPLKSLRGDEKNLTADFEDAGYKTFIGRQGAEDFRLYVPSAGDRVFASFTNDYMPYDLDRTGDCLSSPSLAEMTEKAISALEYDKDGFVLMAEGGRIDHACSDNDTASTVFETLGLNAAVQEVHDFYIQHPEETLIITVGDHETGGLKLGSDLDLSHIKGVRLSVTERLKPFYTGDRKAFYEYLSFNFGLSDLNPSEKARIEDALDFAGSNDYNGDYEGSPASVVSAILSKRMGVSWAGPGHTGVPVPLYAIGLYAENFSGNIDNTDVGRLLFDIIDNSH